MTWPRLSPEASPLTPGYSGLSLSSRDVLGSSSPTSLASSGAEDGVPPSLGLPPRSPPSLTPSPSSSKVYSPQRSYQQRDTVSSTQRGHRRNRLTNPRLLWTPVCGTQAHRRIPPSSRSLFTQQVFGEEEIQNGNSNIGEGFYPQRRLGHFDRSEGRIFSHLDSPEIPQMVEVCERFQCLPVQGLALRPFAGPVDFHASHEGTVYQREKKRDQTAGLSRRLADPECLRVPLSQTHSVTRRTIPLPGVYNPPREVFSYAVPAVQLSGYELRHGELDCLPFPGAHREIRQTTRPPSKPGFSLSSVHCFPNGPDGVPLSSTSVGPAAQETTSEAIQNQMEPDNRLVGQGSVSRGMVPGGSLPVDGYRLALEGRSNLTSFPSAGAVHRCIGSGMGSSLRRAYGFRNVAPSAEIMAHQSSGDAGGARGPASPPPSPQLESHPAMHRQYNRSLLHQQARGGAVGDPLPQSGNYSPTVPRPRHQAGCEACPRQDQHPGGLFKQASHDFADRVDNHQQHSSTSVGGVGEADGRSFCDKIQPQTSDLCEPSHGSPSMEGGRSLSVMGRADSVCFPSYPHPEQGTTEGEAGITQTNPDSSKLARATVVPGSCESLSRSSTKTATRQKRVSSTKVRDRSRQPSISRSSRLATVREQLRASGVSSGALDLLAHAHRPGTQNSYDSCWRRWQEWCREKNRDPIRPSKFDLANFLAFLHTDVKLSSSSIKVHKAAICSSLRQLGRSSYSNDPLIISVLKGASQSDSKVRRRVPAWDLFLVLAHLREPPFEPLNSINLKLLTQKTVFLISLATGRRCSEVHALSGQDFDIKHDRKTNCYTLKFLPEFLAKNQASDQPSPSLSILPLETILAPDDKDLTLCPVRALRRYLHFTKTLRYGKRRLFISHNPSKVGDIRRPTISRWISEVVQDAYKAEASSTSHSSHRAHELRALAASLHFCHTWRLQDVLDASFWRSRNSFIEFYLRDVEGLRQDGSRGISSVVAAQRQVSTSRQA